jgi:hypothetical protein
MTNDSPLPASPAPSRAEEPEIETVLCWIDRLRAAAGDCAIQFGLATGNMQLRTIAQEQEHIYDAIGNYLESRFGSRSDHLARFPQFGGGASERESADKERLDWLNANGEEVTLGIGGTEDDGFWWCISERNRGGTVRSAIDVARNKSQFGGGEDTPK